MLSNRRPCSSFFMAKMASGVDRRRVLPTTTSHKMLAILQRNRLAAACSLGLHGWCTYWHPCYSQLISIDSFENKVSTDQYHVTISQAQVYSSSRSHVLFKLTADQVLVFGLVQGLRSGLLVESRAGLFGGLLTLIQV